MCSSQCLAHLLVVVIFVCLDSAAAYKKATAANSLTSHHGYSYTRAGGVPASEVNLESLSSIRGPPGQRMGNNALLDQAMDAFQQASELEKELKRSEQSVSAQTQELRKELAKAKATARTTGQSSYFRKEEKLDEDLMRQAEKETARDRKLVAQAESEMQGDKKFLVPIPSRARKRSPHPSRRSAG
jgi:hypothetical protein